MEHKDYIDFAKGIGILLVIQGHGIFNNIGLNMFHMPLFFFLSGITFIPPKQYSQFLIRKINRIVVPWVFFTLLSNFVEVFVGNLTPTGVFNAPLWFLQTLMVALIIYSTLHSFVKNEFVLHVIMFVIPIMVYVVTKYTNAASVFHFGLIRALEASFFIHLGWTFNKYYKPDSKSRCAFLGIISSIIFAAFLFYSLRKYHLADASFINTKIYTYNLLLSMIVMISGIMCIVFLSMIISKISFINWLGKNSLVILAVHFPILQRLNYLCFYCFTDLHVTIMWQKGVLALLAYLITLSFSILAAYLCNRYIPKLTGYDNLVNLPINKM